MGTVRLGLIVGGLGGAAMIGACGLVEGGVGGDLDSGSGPDVVMMTDGGGMMDVLMLPDAPMDIMTPDLGTGETEAGILCTCTPLVPNGWNVVTYVQKSTPGCDKAFNGPVNTFENVTAPAPTCACSCGASLITPTTCTGNVTFNVKHDNNNCSTADGLSITAGTSCTMGSWQYNGTGQEYDHMAVSATAPNPSGGQCGNVTVMKSAQQPTSDQGRTCKPKVAPGTCGNGLCVPTPAAPDGICIAMLGIQAQCPMGWPNTHYVGIGMTPFTDTRGCAANQACTLNPGTCSTPQLSAWQSNNNCQGGAALGPQAADGTCQNVGLGNGVTFQSARYTSTPSGASCSWAGQCVASGTVTINAASAMTICCL